MSKRIALIGNMNNNFFPITRHLRDMGYDAHLFYRPGVDHFQPKADTYFLNFSNYCHEVDWLDRGFHNLDEAKIKGALSGFDFYIGQGEEAAAAYKCGFTIDVYYPYGSDGSKYAHLPQNYSTKDKVLSFFRRYKKNKLSYKQMRAGTMAKYLKGAIVNAKYILAEYTNVEAIERLKALHYKGSFKEVPMPFLYSNDYEGLLHGMVPDVHWRTDIDKLRADNDFIILYHGRQEWKTYHYEFNGKNTHHLIIGFANYIKKNPGLKVRLAMLEYGNDLQHSKQLVEELGITQHVSWFPKMYRKDLMYLIKNVDIGCGEFVRSYLTFGTVVEAMFLKKPVIHYRVDSLYEKFYPELYPMLHAREPEEIENAINYAVKHPQDLELMGEQARRWVKKYFIEQPLKVLQEIIEAKKTDSGKN
jgi:glycosyltransferase involved in cell wall biosynthesis